MITWEKYDTATVQEKHGNIYFYRDLYNGQHAKIFSRAENLIKNGDAIEVVEKGKSEAVRVQPPYIVANVVKLIPEIPAALVSRSIGSAKSSLTEDPDAGDEVTDDVNELIDGPEGDGFNADILNVQTELIRQIEIASELAFRHFGNIVQQQVDGGLVGVPVLDARGIRLEFKARDVYFPHPDNLGADLPYRVEIEGDDYLHVYRERVEYDEGGKNARLRTSNFLYKLNDKAETEPVDDGEAARLLGMREMEKVYPGRSRPFIVYWPNEQSIMNPLGVSCLVNQEGKQEEINWTLTQKALTFQRNGKPRIAVSKEVFRALQEKAMERHGDESMIDHRDLEITTFDENGKALEVIQVDLTRIGDLDWIKDLIKLMLMETRTSEKAVDFYMGESAANAQSGVAKFYDLFVSLVKAEQIRNEYVHFLSQLFESALWLASVDDPAVRIEEPEFPQKAMIPVTRKEIVEENVLPFEKGVQSRETTVRKINADSAEEWIQDEIDRILEDAQGDDSTSLANGRYSLMNFLDNPDQRGDAGDNEDAGDDDAAAAIEAAAAAAPGAADDMPALNGAQITSVLTIIQSISDGLITTDQGRALLTDGLKISEDAADRIIRG